jgi:AraC-like DNA-binding protein
MWPVSEGVCAVKVTELSVRGAERAEVAIRQFYPSTSFGAAGSRNALSYDLRVHAAGGVTLLDFTIVAPRFQTVTEDPGFTVCENVTDGALFDGDDPMDTAGGRPVAVPSGIRSDFERVHTRAVQLDSGALQRFARAELADDAFVVRSTGTAALSPAAGAMWTASAQFAEDRMLDGSADHPLVGASLSHLMVSTYLTCFPTSFLGARDRAAEAGPTSRPVRRAIAFIEDNRHLPIDTVDIAQAARLSVRGLQAAFRRERGVTPSQHLRRARLDAVRHELLAADPSRGATVAQIARRWGFVHLGRFARTYRDAYGEPPSATLRS